MSPHSCGVRVSGVYLQLGQWLRQSMSVCCGYNCQTTISSSSGSSTGCSSSVQQLSHTKGTPAGVSAAQLAPLLALCKHQQWALARTTLWLNQYVDCYRRLLSCAECCCAVLRRVMPCRIPLMRCCVYRYGVAIGSTLAPLVRVLMVICSPITWPLGKLLDAILGHENVAMKRQQLKAMVQLHGEGAGTNL